jgi:hypothetical protein
MIGPCSKVFPEPRRIRPHSQTAFSWRFFWVATIRRWPPGHAGRRRSQPSIRFVSSGPAFVAVQGLTRPIYRASLENGARCPAPAGSAAWTISWTIVSRRANGRSRTGETRITRPPSTPTAEPSL